MATERKADKWLDRKLERRALLKKAAIGSASLAVLYVAPKFTSADSRPAYASITATGAGGCTPGFWKTDTPPTTWPTAYPGPPGVAYDSIFAVAGYGATLGGKSLLDVLSQGGGCEKALGRHSAAALLNAANGTLGTKTPAEVITETDAALSTGDCTTITTLKDTYDALNNGGCLDGALVPDTALEV